LAVVGLLVVAVLPAGLGALGRWLVVNDPVDKASAIVVMVGDMPYRAMEAATLYQQGWAPEVWVTRDDRTSREATLLRLGIHPPRDHEYSPEILVRLSVPPSAIRVLDQPILNTMQEVDLRGRREWEARRRRSFVPQQRTNTIPTSGGIAHGMCWQSRERPLAW
jgi:hypothetical protein